MKFLVLFAAILGAASATMRYQFSSGYQDILGGEPVQAFDCEGRPYGYYADAANDCKVFHICLPIADDAGDIIETTQWSFFCGNQTIFSQETLTCTHPEDAFPCDQAETLYELTNAEFGKIPEDEK